MIRRLCPTCSKKRIERLFPKGHRMCELCKIAKANGIKKERKEASSKTWIKRCDSMVGSRVRSRKVCESPRIHKCNQIWQWCHGISRRYHRTRWIIKNGLCMCSGEHKYYTDRPLEWEKVLEQKWGKEYLNYIKVLALEPVTDTSFYKELYKQLTETK